MKSKQLFRTIIPALIFFSQPILASEEKAKQPDLPPVIVNYSLYFGANNEAVNAEDLIKSCDLNGIQKLSKFELPLNAASILTKKVTIEEQPAPNMQMLQYFGRGFNENTAKEAIESKFSVQVLGIGPFDKNHVLLNKVSQCVGKIATKYQAFVFDMADSLTFTPESFQSIRLQEIEKGQFSSAQFGVRAYRVEQGIRSVTMGFEKFGQPNLALENFSEHHMGYMDQFFNLFIQHVIESKSQVSEGEITIDINSITNPDVRQRLTQSVSGVGTGKAKITIRKVTPLAGDPQNLYAIKFNTSPGPELWNEQSLLLKTVFGKDRDISDVPDNVMEEAINAARAKAVKLLDDKSIWQKDGMRFLVAVELAEIKEVVWVEVQSWNLSIGKGILLSNPVNVKNLNSGDAYEFKSTSILDFKLYDAEGIVDKGGVDELARSVGVQR